VMWRLHHVMCHQYDVTAWLINMMASWLFCRPVKLTKSRVSVCGWFACISYKHRGCQPQRVSNTEGVKHRGCQTQRVSNVTVFFVTSLYRVVSRDTIRTQFSKNG